MTATERTAARQESVGRFFAAHRRHLELRVHPRVRGADEQVVADACSYAWLQLLRREDVTLDPRGLRWLALVATQEAWRLADCSRERPAGALIGEPEDEDEL